jgi:hypothetical protein
MRQFNWVWPVITSEDEAKNAAKGGAVMALVVTACIGGFAILAIATGHSYAGIDGYGLVDAGLFALIAWRLFRYSLPWAVFGLVLALSELCWKLYSYPSSVGVISVIIVLSLVAGVRGTFFLRSERRRNQGPNEQSIESRSGSLPIEPS